MTAREAALISHPLSHNDQLKIAELLRKQAGYASHWLHQHEAALSGWRLFVAKLATLSPSNPVFASAETNIPLYLTALKERELRFVLELFVFVYKALAQFRIAQDRASLDQIRKAWKKFAEAVQTDEQNEKGIAWVQTILFQTKKGPKEMLPQLKIAAATVIGITDRVLKQYAKWTKISDSIRDAARRGDRETLGKYLELDLIPLQTKNFSEQPEEAEETGHSWGQWAHKPRIASLSIAMLRLAHTKPHLRRHLLPLVRAAR